MPAPIDWTAAGGIDSVKQLTINHGPREAARMLNLSESHSAALRQLCARGKWMDAVRPQPQPPMPRSMSQPVTRATAVTNDASLSPAAKCGAVTAVTTASDAQAEANAENSRAGRAALLRYGAKVASHAAGLDGGAGLSVAPQMASVAKVLSVAGDWQAAAGGSISVNILVQ